MELVMDKHEIKARMGDVVTDVVKETLQCFQLAGFDSLKWFND
jgi:hypothetical protein